MRVTALTTPALLRTAALLAWRAPVSRVRCASTKSWAKLADEQGIDFVGCFGSVREMPLQRLPEVALLGRSNVGKSSALNSLSKRKKKLAVTSKTPGRTRTINLYHVSKTCTITDLPGYGFARVSDEMQAEWRKYACARRTAPVGRDWDRPPSTMAPRALSPTSSVFLDVARGPNPNPNP